jgi:hypothetical protein
VIVWIAYGVAFAATLLLIRHVARRYPAAPPQLPGVGFDGRPTKRTQTRRVLWLAPIILAALTALLGVLLFRDPPAENDRLTIALVFVVLIEIAWLLAWQTDRQIELARGMTFRIAPARLFRAVLPVLATIALLCVLSLRPA